mgnify:CR=1 FL=1
MPQDTEGGDGAASNTVDYAAISPSSTPPTEYHWTERRAEILDIIEKKGHPSAVDQAQLADRYGVSESQISRDMDRLADHIRDRLENRGHRALVVDSVVQRCIQEMMSKGNFRAAAKTALEWDEFAANFADLEELAERVAELERSHGGA